MESSIPPEQSHQSFAPGKLTPDQLNPDQLNPDQLCAAHSFCAGCRHCSSELKSVKAMRGRV